MSHIFISYRRADSDAIAGRIRDRLASYYGDNMIFMDIDNIPFGLDFRERTQSALLQGDILLVIIGPKWVGRRKDGNTRINDEADPVRIEVETALQKGIRVVPVLVAAASMPNAAALPNSLKELSFRNAAEIDAGRDFHHHMERLIHSLDTILEESAPSPGSPREPPMTGLAIGAIDASTIVQLPDPGRNRISPADRTHAHRRNWLVIGVGAGLCVGIFAGSWYYLKIAPDFQQHAQQNAMQSPAGLRPSPSPSPGQPDSARIAIQKLANEISYTDPRNDRSVISSLVDMAMASKNAEERENIVAVLKDKLIHEPNIRQDPPSRTVRRSLLEGIIKIRNLDIGREFSRDSLSKMDLVAVDLQNVKAQGVNFAGAFLLRSDFRKANLRGARFTSSSLRLVNFENADISGAAFDDADWFNAVGLTTKQLQGVAPSRLALCPTTAEGTYSKDKFIEFANSHYLFKYPTWSESEQQISNKAWSEYMQPGGPCDLVKNSQ
jgi:hypothetical protein